MTADLAFKNFHRLLCERFGYRHDEQDWQRDQLSLIEFIAAKIPTPAEGDATTDTGDANGRRDELRSAVHGRVPVGGHTSGALADLLWASPDVMSLNAELGLTMDQLVKLAQALSKVIPDVQPKGMPASKEPHNGHDKEPRDPESYPYLDARGDDRGQGLDSYWKWGYAAGWNDHKKHAAQASAPAPDHLELFKEAGEWAEAMKRKITPDMIELLGWLTGAANAWAEKVEAQTPACSNRACPCPNDGPCAQCEGGV